MLKTTTSLEEQPVAAVLVGGHLLRRLVHLGPRRHLRRHLAQQLPEVITQTRVSYPS